MKATYLVVIPIILKFDSNIGFFLRLLRKSATNTFFSWLWHYLSSLYSSFAVENKTLTIIQRKGTTYVQRFYTIRLRRLRTQIYWSRYGVDVYCISGSCEMSKVWRMAYISIRISCMSTTWWIVWLEQAYLPTYMEKHRRNCIRYIRGIHKISC